MRGVKKHDLPEKICHVCGRRSLGVKSGKRTGMKSNIAVTLAARRARALRKVQGNDR